MNIALRGEETNPSIIIPSLTILYSQNDPPRVNRKPQAFILSGLRFSFPFFFSEILRLQM